MMPMMMEFEKLEEEVDGEMQLELDMDGKLPHEWLEAKAKTVEGVTNADVAKLARKMAMMIRRAALPSSSSEENDDTEAVITEFVEQLAASAASQQNYQAASVSLPEMR
eukprot:scaffold184080_cov42-Prasinocladus_malaysianus.AAC.1